MGEAPRAVGRDPGLDVGRCGQRSGRRAGESKVRRAVAKSVPQRYSLSSLPQRPCLARGPFPMFSPPSGRSLRANLTLTILLASVAGYVNGSGFLLFGVNTSHMTGNAAYLGEALGGGLLSVAWFSARLLLAFLFGAATTAVLLEVTARWKRARHVPAILGELLLIGGVAAWAQLHPGAREPLLTQALAFAMGMQNALVTRVSGAVVRTTHLTGVITDIGLELVHWVRFWGEHIRAGGLGGVAQGLKDILTDPWFGRAWLHLALVVSFTGGAGAAALLLSAFSPWVLGVPCAVLALLCVDDLMQGREPATAGAPASHVHSS